MDLMVRVVLLIGQLIKPDTAGQDGGTGDIAGGDILEMTKHHQDSASDDGEIVS